MLLKVGVWLLTAQKPMKRQVWQKEKFALFWMLTSRSKGDRRVDSCPKVNSPTPPPSPRPLTVARDLIHKGIGLHAAVAQSALTVSFKPSVV